MLKEVKQLQGIHDMSHDVPDLRYFIGHARPRFWLFGKSVIRWTEQPRDYFYDAMRATNLVSSSVQVSLCDVVLQAGATFQAGPFHFKGVSK